MEKFRFYQDKEVKTWVRDYYYVEAESLEDAVKYVKEQNDVMENIENKFPGRVYFDERDVDMSVNTLEEAPMRVEIGCHDIGGDGFSNIINKIYYCNKE